MHATNSPDLLEQCRLHRELGRYKEAVSGYEDILRQDPENLFVAGCLAETLTTQGYASKALEVLAKARRDQLPEVETLLYAATELQRCLLTPIVTGNFDEAIGKAKIVYASSEELLATRSLDTNTVSLLPDSKHL